MKQLLQACRDNFGPAPRTMNAAQADAFRVRLRGGLEAMQREENDAMVRILEDQHLLRERGRVYWGHFIQANQVLFQPGNAHTCPANLVFSTEPFFDDKPNLLGQLARGLGGMKGGEPADPSLADFVHVITDERARILCRELPRPYCRGHLAYFATVYVEPRQLPGGYLAYDNVGRREIYRDVGLTDTDLRLGQALMQTTYADFLRR